MKRDYNVLLIRARILSDIIHNVTTEVEMVSDGIGAERMGEERRGEERRGEERLMTG